jgi:hypothetical protein
MVQPPPAPASSTSPADASPGRAPPSLAQRTPVSSAATCGEALPARSTARIAICALGPITVLVIRIIEPQSTKISPVRSAT